MNTFTRLRVNETRIRVNSLRGTIEVTGLTCTFSVHSPIHYEHVQIYFHLDIVAHLVRGSRTGTVAGPVSRLQTG